MNHKSSPCQNFCQSKEKISGKIMHSRSRQKFPPRACTARGSLGISRTARQISVLWGIFPAPLAKTALAAESECNSYNRHAGAKSECARHNHFNVLSLSCFNSHMESFCAPTLYYKRINMYDCRWCVCASLSQRARGYVLCTCTADIERAA